MFKVNFTTDSTATLTPSRLLMMDSTNTNNTDWNFNAPSVNEFNSYMNEMNPFDDQSALFGGQKFIAPTTNTQPTQEQKDMMMMSPQQQYENKQEMFTQSPPTPPSLTGDTPPQQQKRQRKKLLEKNREAAYRCRQKKKKWVNDLEERSEKAEHQNKELQEQVAQLREESIYLRNLLLTHGNCECDVVQTYLRRTSEQLSMTTAPATTTAQLPSLIASNSSVSGSESSTSSAKQFYNPTVRQQNFMLQ